MKSETHLTGERSPLGFLRPTFAVVAVAALTLCGSVSFADDEPAEAAKPAASDDAATSSSCTAPGHTGHPQDDPTVCPVEKGHGKSPETGSNSASALASKLANPSAPMMAMNSFLDITQNGGSAPGAHRSSFTYSFQPASPSLPNEATSSSGRSSRLNSALLILLRAATSKRPLRSEISRSTPSTARPSRTA